MGKNIVLEELEAGGLVGVELSDLLAMMEIVAGQKGIDLAAATTKQKKEILRSMGYEKYFPILKKEAEFSWL